MVENVTFTANEGVTVKNFEADGGAHISAGAGTAPVYDYVRDTGSWVTEGSCYYKRAILKNITFNGLTFTAKTDINTSEPTTVYDGFTFKDCTFNLGTTADGNQAIRYYNENNNDNVKNLVVEGCTFKTCYQGVYTVHVKNVTVTGCTFDTTGHNAIAIQDFSAYDHGEVVITGNTFKGIGDRIIRFNNVGMGTTVTITGNTADGNSGKLDEATGKREIVKATTLPENAADSIKASGNNWGANTVVEGVFIDRESEHVPEGYVVDENGNVTISDEESLFWFAQQVNVRGNTFTGKTVSLADDIALTAKWTPVGVSVEKSFKGTFDGKDHAITEMQVSEAWRWPRRNTG